MPVRPKKSLGQHFLRDENIARKIVGQLNPAIPLVLEIGPGKGVMSKYLLDDPRFDPWFIEIDRESVAYLKEIYPAIRDRLIEADFLKFDMNRFFSSHEPRALEHGATRLEGTKAPQHAAQNSGTPLPFRGGAGGGVSILGNFPYNISSQILFRVLEYRNLVQEVTGMFQREVAQRIASPPGSKAYGILSVLLQAFYRIEYLFTVNETVFTPPPKVKSAVIKLIRNDVTHLGCEEEAWIRVVKTAFNQRRKTLRNSLRRMAPEHFAGWDEPVFSLRPEQLDVADFVELARLLDTEQSDLQ